jgi:Zn-dependent peptidase ImmA (M78 family)
MRRGFKTRAKQLALEVREELGLDAYERFDPYALAEEYGIPIYSLRDLGRDKEAREAATHYMGGRTITFSAALVPLGHKRLILDNDTHLYVRRRNSISHEMSHVLLEHSFGKVLLNTDGCRAFDKDKEKEADWLGGELLIPYVAAERAARRNLTDLEVAELFDVSEQLARMRMNSSGARKVIAQKRAYWAKKYTSAAR